MNKQQIVEILTRHDDEFVWYEEEEYQERKQQMFRSVADEILALEDRLEIVDLEGQRSAHHDMLQKFFDEQEGRSAQWQPGVLEKCRTGLKECACSVCNPDILNIMQRTGDEPV